MNNDMMLVPRELLERLDCGKNMKCALDSLPELRSMLAAPAAQAVDEPPAAHCFLRRNGNGVWVNDSMKWFDGAPPDELVAETVKYPELYRIRLAYDYAALAAPVQSKQEPVACVNVERPGNIEWLVDPAPADATNLYAAPVRAARLPEAKTRQEVINNTHYSQGWNECVAETARLNTPQ
ncbi:hypothetical protein K5D33_07595 [Pseudomonas cichorii]|nr:hypothetical protein [Pseudomonas cichorii]MBX8534586.1 hypothetical protein [Pseudomonas cichorii]